MCVRFGHDYDQTCMQMDEACSRPLCVHWVEISCSGRPSFLRYAGVKQVLASVADQIKNFAVIYLVDISEVCLLALAGA